MEYVSYEQMKGLLNKYCEDIKCVVSFKLMHHFENGSGKEYVRTSFKILEDNAREVSVFRDDGLHYTYSTFNCKYFDHDDTLCMITENIVLEELSNVQCRELNKIMNGAKKKSFICDKETSIIKDSSLIKEEHAGIVKFINGFKSGTKLHYILIEYGKQNTWDNAIVNSIDDILLLKNSYFEFNKDNDNLLKDKKVFDYIRITIPVLKKNMTYDEVVKYIRDNSIDLNSMIYIMLKKRLAWRNLPIGILKDKPTVVLTRTFELVYTFTVKELKEDKVNENN